MKRKKSFKCDICDASSAKKVVLKSHVEAKGGKKPFKCNTCDCEFNRHMTKVHEGKELPNQDASNVHDGENLETPDQKLLSNTTESNKFQCPISLKIFSSKYSVIDHIYHVHEGKKNKFECSTCF